MSDLLVGQVTHTRAARAERSHRFAYPFFGVVVPYPVREVGRWFTHNRLGVLSFADEDHGDRVGGDVMAWLRRELEAAQAPVTPEMCSIEVMTMPRVLGFVFNPVSFWFLSASEGELTAVVAEVNNTFGGTHSYVLHRSGEPITAEHWLHADKAFYVSPFFEVRGGYRFRFDHGPAGTDVRLHHLDEQGRTLLTARVGGRRIRVTPLRVLRHAASAIGGVWLALMRIHLQALFLYAKGVTLVPRDRGLGRPVSPTSSRSH